MLETGQAAHNKISEQPLVRQEKESKKLVLQPLADEPNTFTESYASILIFRVNSANGNSQANMYIINREWLVALAQVVNDTKKLKKEMSKQILDLTAQIKIKDVDFSRLCSKHEALKKVKSSSVYSSYIEMLDKVGSIHDSWFIDDWNE